jgi:hypothetical protein
MTRFRIRNDTDADVDSVSAHPSTPENRGNDNRRQADLGRRSRRSTNRRSGVGREGQSGTFARRGAGGRRSGLCIIRPRQNAGIRGSRHQERNALRFDSEITQENCWTFVQRLNDDSGVDGILVQLPLPDHIAESAVIDAIRPEKDVDGFPSRERRTARTRDSRLRTGDSGWHR